MLLRSAISAFTRVFDALWLAAWCAANPGAILFNDEWVPALHRVRDTKDQAAAARFTEASASDVRLSSVFFSSCRV
jgi:hypothetical protein